jgi:hypothetical protein
MKADNRKGEDEPEAVVILARATDFSGDYPPGTEYLHMPTDDRKHGNNIR